MGKSALVLAALLAIASPAAAQQPSDEDETSAAGQETPEIDWSRIHVDALHLLREVPSSAGLRAGTPSDAESWNRSENRNGSANVALRRSFASGIATHVGVDSVGSQQGWAPPGAAPSTAGGAGWARAAIPGAGLIDQATLDARLDPDSDQRRFGARFEKSIPLNPQVSVTLQNGYGVSQPLANQTLAGTTPPAQVLEIEQLAKLHVLNSGTSLFAGSKQSSVEDRRLNLFGAEQNLTGGISVSGAISETAAGGHDRSLTARFRRTW